MPNMNVTFAEMQDAANRLRNGKEELIAKLEELSSQIDNLVSSGFVTDTASGAYSEKFHEFKTGATTVVGSLDGLSSFLDGAASALQTADQDLANQIRA
ncbi:WXG100 family type VII secretion target [Nocardioides flavescens]|uniref:WXG100 family type VII secretion target n=1 Tax=Nocardioides flavescens TaxID=2691959 RepID=A0A6L7EY69_9ACTN|nr:WXG100 family type VII secretion target [Nocardioides flavescens]MXG90896.1 WXG100 family type VII secretion target [Nocardioides flavescens]